MKRIYNVTINDPHGVMRPHCIIASSMESAEKGVQDHLAVDHDPHSVSKGGIVHAITPVVDGQERHVWIVQLLNSRNTMVSFNVIAASKSDAIALAQQLAGNPGQEVEVYSRQGTVDLEVD